MGIKSTLLKCMKNIIKIYIYCIKLATLRLINLVKLLFSNSFLVFDFKVGVGYIE